MQKESILERGHLVYIYKKNTRKDGKNIFLKGPKTNSNLSVSADEYCED